MTAVPHIRLVRLTAPAASPTWPGSGSSATANSQYRIDATGLVCVGGRDGWTLCPELGPGFVATEHWLTGRDLAGRIFGRLADLRRAVAAEWAVSPPPAYEPLADDLTLRRRPDGVLYADGPWGRALILRRSGPARWDIHQETEHGAAGDPMAISLPNLQKVRFALGLRAVADRHKDS